MTKKHSAKRSLIASILVLCLCLTSFIGTTFAWFTDSVTSAGNIIKSGTLDVEMYWADGTKSVPADKADWTDASTGAIFNNDKWEPGYTEARHIKIANEGTLALKYQLAIIPNGEVSKLADVIDVYYVEGGKQVAARADLATLTPIGTLADLINNGIATGALDEGENYVATLVLKMQEDADNEYQNLSIGTDFSVRLLATQATSEKDSFDKYYDAGAEWYGESDIDWYLDDPDATEFNIYTPEQVAGLAEIVNGTATSEATTFAAESTVINVHDDFSGKTVYLNSDINLAEISWTPIGRIGTSSTDFTYAFRGTFDGNGNTIYNLKAAGEGWVGVFGLAYKATIKNLTVSGVDLNGNRMTGSVVGQLYGSIDNCHVEHATIKVVPNEVSENKYDNGDKVGGIVGWLGDNGNNHYLTNCSASDVQLTAYRDVGGIAGYVSYSTDVIGNEVNNVTVTVDQITNYYGDKDFNAGAIWGRNSISSTDEGVDAKDNEQTEVSITSKYVDDGLEFHADGVSGEVTLYMVPADYEDTKVNVPEGVTNIGGYAFAYNQNIEEIVLPSSVTTLNDRAFRDTSAKKVVLNEGLENISYQAFRNASNVTEVVIPSTVTTISKEAFQNSGIKTLTIPATVKTLEYGACRDMKLLESVTIAGNVDVPAYAFRACTNLKTVVITGEDVTFGAGSRGMIFTNKENGDGSAITVYVANETVKDRLLAADTAAKDYGGYEIIVGIKAPEADKPLADSFTNGADTVYIPAGTYNFPASNLSAGDTIVCAEGTVFEGTSGLNINGATVIGATFDAGDKDTSATGTINGTFKDCTFTGGSEGVRWCYSTAGTTVVFENCVFESTFRGIHFDGMNGDVIFRNCEINGFNAIGGTGTVTFEGCTFGCDRSRYNGLNMYVNTILTDCTFDFTSGKTNFIDFEAAGKTLKITNCTATLDGEAANILTFVGGTYLAQTNITVDGATYTYVSNGLYKNGADYYAYNAVGFEAMYNYIKSNGTAHAIWGATFNVMADIDASGMVWDSIFANTPNNDCEGFTFDGHGHTISGMKINGSMFHSTANGKNTEVPTTFKNITFDGVTVVGGYHTGIVWGQMYGDIVLDNVHVKNSSVTGTCNVGALIGRNGDGGASTVAYKNCSVTNTAIVALGNGDPNGASIFLGSALTIGTDVTAKITFENCTQSGNTVTCADGQVGGGIYAWWNASTNETGAVNGFENYN